MTCIFLKFLSQKFFYSVVGRQRSAQWATTSVTFIQDTMCTTMHSAYICEDLDVINQPDE